MLNTLRLHCKAAVLRWPLRIHDAHRNARDCRGDRRILITRHAAKSAHVFEDFMKWICMHAPELYARIEFRRLPCRVSDWSRYALHTSWAGDTFQYWDQRGWKSAVRLEDECRSRGIPIVNPVTSLHATQKSRCAARLAALGIRTPRMIPISNAGEFRETACGLDFPLLVREDRGHGKPVLFIRNRSELRAAAVEGFENPVAVEFIDTRSPEDGLYRKYRYTAFGDRGCVRHIHVSDEWEVRPERRVMNEALRRYELDYLAAPDPNEPVLQEARRALGMDIVGFDYSYDANGELVVWEANAFANFNYPKNPLARHVLPAAEHCLRMLAAYYLSQAGLPVPARITDQIGAYAFDRRYASRQLLAA